MHSSPVGALQPRCASLTSSKALVRSCASCRLASRPARHTMTVPAAAPPSHSSSNWEHRAGGWAGGSSSGSEGPPAPKSPWIFGFGSLVWHPGVEVEEEVKPCFIRGYRRVFWQGSTDHRGTPEAPGRTVTLEPCEGAITWGAAFRLAGDEEQRRRTWRYLDWREKQYDSRVQVEVYCPASGSGSSSGSDGSGTEGMATLTALTFIATSDRSRNSNYLGPASLEDIARQVATARGPSGPNYEYLFRLADAMRAMSVRDEELFLLEAKVRARLRVLEAGAAGDAALFGSSGSSNGDGDGSSGAQQSAGAAAAQLPT